jgi:hypothetical protein
VRIVIFSVLIFAERTGRQSISLLPLVLTLYPEGALIRNDVTWTVWSAIGFCALLVAGGFLMAVPVALILNWVRD